jgi:membrane protein implicated in regulation of membrane protease activity
MLLIGAILLAVFVLPEAWDVPVVLAAAAVEIAETGFWLWYTRRRRARVGAETLIGATGRVVTPCLPMGQVRIEGELWRARCDEGADVGDQVRVLELDGLTLVVERAT